MTRLKTLLAASAVTMAVAQGAAAQSTYSCMDLNGFNSLPSVEGSEGVFFRVNPELRNFHAFSDHTVGQVAQLSAALAQAGTTLVYAPMPPKSMVMTDHLPQIAFDYGFEPELAGTVYNDMIVRLRDAGVTVADLRHALASGTQSGMPYFASDYRLNDHGAEVVAQAIAQATSGQPMAQAAPLANPLAVQQPVQTAALGVQPTPVTQVQPQQPQNVSFASRIQSGATQSILSNAAPTPVAVEDTTIIAPEVVETLMAQPNAADAGGSAMVEVASEMRSQLQQHCMLELPKTTISAAPSAPGGTSGVVVVGSEYTGTPEVGFAARLGNAVGGAVHMVSSTDAGAYASIASYLTSAAFEAERPRVLVWENPVYHNLASYGDQPMRELIAAASGSCRAPVQIQSSDGPGKATAMLAALGNGPRPTLFFDAGTESAREARFTFHSPSGFSRTRIVTRPRGATASGRFYVPMSGLWAEGITHVEIETDIALGASPRLMACAN